MSKKSNRKEGVLVDFREGYISSQMLVDWKAPGAGKDAPLERCIVKSFKDDKVEIANFARKTLSWVDKDEVRQPNFGVSEGLWIGFMGAVLVKVSERDFDSSDDRYYAGEEFIPQYWEKKFSFMRLRENKGGLYSIENEDLTRDPRTVLVRDAGNYAAGTELTKEIVDDLNIEEIPFESRTEFYRDFRIQGPKKTLVEAIKPMASFVKSELAINNASALHSIFHNWSTLAPLAEEKRITIPTKVAEAMIDSFDAVMTLPTEFQDAAIKSMMPFFMSRREEITAKNTIVIRPLLPLSWIARGRRMIYLQYNLRAQEISNIEFSAPDVSIRLVSNRHVYDKLRPAPTMGDLAQQLYDGHLADEIDVSTAQLAGMRFQETAQP